MSNNKSNKKKHQIVNIRLIQTIINCSMHLNFSRPITILLISYFSFAELLWFTLLSIWIHKQSNHYKIQSNTKILERIWKTCFDNLCLSHSRCDVTEHQWTVQSPFQMYYSIFPCPPISRLSWCMVARKREREREWEGFRTESQTSHQELVWPLGVT